MGYHNAGFEVVGVDIENQRNYPFEFHKSDALEYLIKYGHEFDVIHASPPCQAYSITGNLARAQGNKASEIDLVEPTRELLIASGKNYVIENVPGAPLINPVVLCGSMFGLKVRRHRLFESNVDLGIPPLCRHKEQGRPVGVYGSKNDNIPSGGKTARTLEEGQEAMGIDWMPWSKLVLAIPPIYTTWVGFKLNGLKWEQELDGQISML
jgi:DNA (cytosine-5)-methyltransferase 1